jgi:2,4'-dihydroxyacetophenone dioxygenase
MGLRSGPIEYIGPDGQVTHVETAQTKLQRYLDFCASADIRVAPVIA